MRLAENEIRDIKRYLVGGQGFLLYNKPFEQGENRRIANKNINDSGIGSLKIISSVK